MVTQYNVYASVKENESFLERNLRFVTTLELNKCLKQIRLSILLNTLTPISELPSNLSTAIKKK